MEEDPNTVPVSSPVTDTESGTTLRTVVIVVAVVLPILVVLGAAVYGMVSYPEVTSVLRDISIIALALLTIVIGLFLIVLIFQLQSLIVLLRDEIRPILESANETAGTVRGTTTFVSDAVVTPMITAASYASAAKQTLKVRVGGGRKQPKPKGEKTASSLE